MFLAYGISLLSYATSLTPTPHVSCRCLPSQPCWPSEKDWHQLKIKLKGKLVKPKLGIADCYTDANSQECSNALKDIKNPFYLESIPGGLQSQGMLNAWDGKASNYAIEAENTQDVIEGINFARNHNLRLVIKGTGHDYLGRSSAPDSLLIWTHKMRDITLQDHFIAQGCGKNTATPAVTVGAGTRWIETYQKVTTQHHRYVQGGGCTSVGAAGGFTQGGGFGSFSKQFGTGAGGILEVELVTADGKKVIANACQNTDLFWAVRGGGAGTYGVVTKMTLLTHDLPQNFGVYKGTITANNDDSYKKLIKKIALFFREHLNNPNWGEQITFTPNNQVEMALVFQGLTKRDVARLWAPFQDWLSAHPTEFKQQISLIEIPGNKLFDYHYLKKHHPTFITLDDRKNAPKGQFWWASNSIEIYRYWYAYRSWWLDKTVFDDQHLDTFVSHLFQASRFARVGFHINKGLSGASPEAIQRSSQTSMNPSVYQSPALVIIADGTNQQFMGIKNHAVNTTTAETSKHRIDKAMALIMSLSPNSGAYVNEADFFQKNWQQAFWGKHYKKLLALKKHYDPQGLFYCHHCVGSEYWTENGMCRIH
jgi:FAD/FMN-containing dehydrogenase